MQVGIVLGRGLGGLANLTQTDSNKQKQLKNVQLDSRDSK